MLQCGSLAQALEGEEESEHKTCAHSEDRPLFFKQQTDSSVQDGIYALRKAHLSFRSFLNIASEISNVHLIDSGPLWPFQGRLPSTSSFYVSLLQVNNDAMSLALCPQVVSQASQHLKQETGSKKEGAGKQGLECVLIITLFISF